MVLTYLFDKNRWTFEAAQEWLRANGAMQWTKAEIRPNGQYIRFRQFATPRDIPQRYITIDKERGILALIVLYRRSMRGYWRRHGRKSS